MSLNRVVITGMGAVSPYGEGVPALMEGLLAGRSGVSTVAGLTAVGGLRTRVAGLVSGVDPKKIPRKFRRSMSNMSVYAYLACEEALLQAGLDAEQYRDGRTGVAIGSTVGSTQATEEFFVDFLSDRSLERMKSTTFFQIMNHSCAANVAQALGLSGRLMASAAACATGCQTLGYGYETIAFGKQERMLCGGADEFHPLTAATFDILNAASVAFNNEPHRTPRPFDRQRDGVVCAEGSGVVLLESLVAAQRRQAPILGEIIGFATCCDPESIANPNAGEIERCMLAALDDAGIPAEQIDYVNAHATATELGDIAEGQAIARVFGSATPVSSLKGHIGHAMAASGALEFIAAIEMMRHGSLIPTLNLEEVDPACGVLNHLHEVTPHRTAVFIKNSFALGGVNSSIVARSFA
ncbi:MAG: beta-ketoacyl-[acyl-carrier-protein] synthase family protein [Desulfuromonadales bacterium]